MPAYAVQIGRCLHEYVPLVLWSCYGRLLQCRMANLSGHVSAVDPPPACKSLDYTEKFATGATGASNFSFSKSVLQDREHQHPNTTTGYDAPFSNARTRSLCFVSGFRGYFSNQAEKYKYEARRLFIDVVASRWISRAAARRRPVAVPQSAGVKSGFGARDSEFRVRR